MSIQDAPAELPDRLGWLLKHAYLRFAELSDGAVAPFGVTARQVAVMRAIHSPQPQAQGDVARRLGIDRTTMVALVDELQDKDLARRRPDAADRRKNVVELTDSGRDVLQQANQAAAQAEQEFLLPLTAGQADQLRSTLQALLAADAPRLPGRAATHLRDPAGERPRRMRVHDTTMALWLRTRKACTSMPGATRDCTGWRFSSTTRHWPTPS